MLEMLTYSVSCFSHSQCIFLCGTQVSLYVSFTYHVQYICHKPAFLKCRWVDYEHIFLIPAV